MTNVERHAGIRRFGNHLLDLLLPPQCLACGVTINQQGGLCTTCWEAIDFLSPPCCVACGYPFEFDAGEETLCVHCLEHRPIYGRARAVMRYGPRPAIDLSLIHI